MNVIDYDLFEKQLKQTFCVECLIFLEDLEHNPSSYFYKSLAPFLRPSYDENQRFILCNCRPLASETLSHVAGMINYLDISPYFVEVYTNQSSTAEFFSRLPEPIKVNCIDIKRSVDKSSCSTKPLFNDNGVMCAYAWSGVHVWTDGTTSPCCVYRERIVDGHNNPLNVRNSSIQDIVDSPYMKNLRDQMRNGTTPEACQNCTRHEQHGMQSRRTMAPYRLQNIYGLINWESDQASDNLGYVGGHLGNLCNLKCRICDASFSSTIATEDLSQIPHEQKKDHESYRWLARTSWVKQHNEFWTSLQHLAGQVKNFEFLGGEPLKLPQNLMFMQYLIDHGYSHACIFDITTNGTVYPDIMKQADKFARIDITLSLDNLGSRFEYERSGSDWDQVYKNIKSFLHDRDHCDKVRIGVCITVNVQNVYYLPELIDWIDQHHFDSYYLNILEHPAYLSIYNLTASAKSLILDKLTTWQSNDLNRKNIEFVCDIINKSMVVDGSEFVEKMKHKDQLRKENFANTHIEIAKAMGYHEVF